MSLKQSKKDNKLSPKYCGLYKVLQKIGTMAYKLELPVAPNFPCFKFKEGYRRQALSSNNIART